MNREALLKQIERWHAKDGDHRRIIDTIEALPAEERDYTLTGLLARAYNNLAVINGEGLAHLSRAEELLRSVAAEGENDATWHYRLGYTLYYLDREEEALACFRRALALNPEEPDALYFIDRCRRTLDARAQGASPETAGEETGERSGLYVTLHLNARFQPKHRHDLEDLLEEALKRDGLGTLEGGGSLLDSTTQEIMGCDIELRLEKEDYIDHLMSLLERVMIPKGSQLICGHQRVFPVGQAEGLALYLNGTDLPDEVYRDCDINYVIQRAEELLGEEGQLYSWWEGPRNTGLYFYGFSYETMHARLRDFLGEYPLCQKCVVTRIA